MSGIDYSRAKKSAIHIQKKPRIRLYSSPAGYCSLVRYFEGREEFWFGLYEIALRRAYP